MKQHVCWHNGAKASCSSNCFFIFIPCLYCLVYRRGEHNLYLRKRKGFIKVCQMSGTGFIIIIKRFR